MLERPLFVTATLMIIEALLFGIRPDLAWALVFAVVSSAMVELIKD